MKAINKMGRVIIFAMVLALSLGIFALAAFAEDAESGTYTDDTAAEVSDSAADADTGSGSKAMAAGIAVGITAAAGAIGMGIAIAKSVEGISRQPEAEGKIRTTLMLGLVFVETAIIYALIIAVLIIFVL